MTHVVFKLIALKYFLRAFSAPSLLLSNLVAIDVATLALTHGTFHVACSTTVSTGESGTLAAVARATHHVFTERAALLDGSLKILISLLLDGLRVL